MATFTHKDMERFAAEAWGDLGISTVRKWVEFNERYFNGELQPVPLVITHTQAFGRKVGFCSHSHGLTQRLIALNVPREHGVLVANNNTLLHEMIHQLLQERGENSKHASEGWRREIMRLHKLITGNMIWAGAPTTKRIEGEDGKLSKIVRINKPSADGTKSLAQQDIAYWPMYKFGINLGQLGGSTPSAKSQKRNA